MSHVYKAIDWNRFKRRYDLVLALGLLAFLGAFMALSIAAQPPGQSFTPMQLAIRAFGAAAFLLLNIILAIGPLARLSKRFIPLLYNRRHLGVVCFVLALIHGVLNLLWYQGFSALNPLVALFVSNPRYTSIAGFPFESLGFAALVILAFLAVSSHDYWQKVLGSSFWKVLHMGIYFAYALLVLHILLGVVQEEKPGLYFAAVAGAFLLVSGLHFASALIGRVRDKKVQSSLDGWINLGDPAAIPDTRARIVHTEEGQRIAVFRYDGKISAVSNVCAHQNGPLGEGRVTDGCVTCPWHGWQYRPEDGRSPPPYNEMIPTYRVQIDNGILYVHPQSLAPGTPTPPAVIEGS